MCNWKTRRGSSVPHDVLHGPEVAFARQAKVSNPNAETLRHDAMTIELQTFDPSEWLILTQKGRMTSVMRNRIDWATISTDRWSFTISLANTGSFFVVERLFIVTCNHRRRTSPERSHFTPPHLPQCAQQTGQRGWSGTNRPCPGGPKLWNQKKKQKPNCFPGRNQFGSNGETAMQGMQWRRFGEKLRRGLDEILSYLCRKPPSKTKTIKRFTFTHGEKEILWHLTNPNANAQLAMKQYSKMEIHDTWHMTHVTPTQKRRHFTMTSWSTCQNATKYVEKYPSQKPPKSFSVDFTYI